MTLAEQMYEALGPFAEDDESGDLQAFCEVLCGPLEPIWERVRDRDDMPGWTLLFNADLAPVEALPWLAQFVGVQLQPGWSEQEQRDAIKDPPGFRRGTRAAMRRDVQRTLTGTKSLSIFERDGSAYALTVRTLTSETPDEAATLAAVLGQKPIGLALDYDAIAGQTWNDVVAAEATWNDVVADYPTWNDLVTAAP